MIVRLMDERARPSAEMRDAFRFCGNPEASLRILVIAGQHGDEPLANRAAQRFAQQFETCLAAGRAESTPDVRLAVISMANPTGYEKRQRRNAGGVDLNRDHLRLSSDETQTIHELVREWRPTLIVDVHTFPPRRKHLLKRNLVYRHDVFLDVPTNPSVRLPLSCIESMRFLDDVTQQVDSEGFACGRYFLINKSCRVRHSTPDIVDARNGLALRYGAFSVLLEGRQPTRHDTADTKDRVLNAMTATLRAIVNWADANRSLLTRTIAPPRRGQPVTIRSGYTKTAQRSAVMFSDARTGEPVSVDVTDEYTPHVESTQTINLPAAYAVPVENNKLIELLHKHGFASCKIAGEGQVVQRYGIQKVNLSRRENRAPHRIDVEVLVERSTLDGYVTFPVDQAGGHSLAVLLEPQSKYGLVRFEEFGLPPKQGSVFSVLRVL